jgi:hypothetical protein
VKKEEGRSVLVGGDREVAWRVLLSWEEGGPQEKGRLQTLRRTLSPASKSF